MVLSGVTMVLSTTLSNYSNKCRPRRGWGGGEGGGGRWGGDFV